jgi:hypothetical protein
VPVSETPSPQPPVPQRQKSAPGVGSALGNALAAATGGLVHLTSRLFGEVRERAGEFRARPEHSRWRAYALGSYGMLLAATLAGQFYDDNSLRVYVRVQPVELPAMTQIFVRNDSKHAWSHVKLTLNGIYTYEQSEVQPGLFILLPVNRFALFDGNGRPTYAPKNIAPRQLAIDVGEQHYETELKP